MSAKVITGDCVEAMAAMNEASVDAVVCDPPYELGFMGKSWDSSGVAYQPETWAAALRVLKPGGHLLAFGGTRTFHRLTVAIEDAGFEIRDCLSWLYGSGFPKGLDVSKAIDKAAGAEPDAEHWQGWGTALKPAWEPIVVARKPLDGTVAANVLAHGTGAINVDGCRIGTVGGGSVCPGGDDCQCNTDGRAFSPTKHPVRREGEFGRWPANVVLGHNEDCRMLGERKVPSNAPARYATDAEATLYGDGLGKRVPGDERPGYADEDGLETVERWACVPGCPVRALDDQSGRLQSGSGPLKRNADKFRNTFGAFAGSDEPAEALYGDVGGASRFFYCAKGSRAERNAGLDRMAEGPSLKMDPTSAMARDGRRGTGVAANVHPTVKPVELMRWLVRLVTPPGGTVLDPFTGSGTTGCAAVREGFDFIGIERESEYVTIAKARIKWWGEHPDGMETSKVYAAEKRRAAVADLGQTDIFGAIE